jgi:hypothetical protein
MGLGKLVERKAAEAGAATSSPLKKKIPSPVLARRLLA